MVRQGSDTEPSGNRVVESANMATIGHRLSRPMAVSMREKSMNFKVPGDFDEVSAYAASRRAVVVCTANDIHWLKSCGPPQPRTCRVSDAACIPKLHEFANTPLPRHQR